MSLQSWIESRSPGRVTHLDAAAAGRPSVAALAAQFAHLRREVETGGYIAEAEAEQGALPAGRQALGRLVGLPGEQVAYTDSGSTAFASLLEAWQLPAGSRIGTITGEFGANAAVLHVLAAQRGWNLVHLPVDDLGRITDLVPELDLLTFPQILSQRGVVQPVADVLASSVPLILDVAQSLGQADVPAGCAAYVGTSRKWMCGPRGVGMLAVDRAYEERLVSPPTMSSAVNTGMRQFEPLEANIAGRVGFAVAAQEWTPDVLPEIHRLATGLRALLGENPCWQVVESVDSATGITTLLIDDDPFAVRARLLGKGFLVSAVPVARAADVPQPLLRVSTPAWLTEVDLQAFVEALRSVS